MCIHEKENQLSDCQSGKYSNTENIGRNIKHQPKNGLLTKSKPFFYNAETAVIQKLMLVAVAE